MDLADIVKKSNMIVVEKKFEDNSLAGIVKIEKKRDFKKQKLTKKA